MTSEDQHLFHEKGEITVTLEDVGYILVLPITGRPIVGDGISSTRDFFARNWFESLTYEQVELVFTRVGMKYT